jgi:inorganic pyrophosphatase
MEKDREFWDYIDKLVADSTIVIDRHQNTAHPRFPDMIYPVDYGCLENTTSMDGGGIDVWRGTDNNNAVDAVICTVDLYKRDSEIKILIGCTEDEKQTIMDFLNSKMMRGLLIRRVV